MVASFVEGRVRLRHAELKNPSIMEKVIRELEACQGIERLAANRKVGSLLVYYDKFAIKRDEILSSLRQYLTEGTAPTETGTVATGAPQCRWPRVAISKRQLINLSLLLSLVGSLLALPFGATTAHIQIGLLFAAASLLHMFDKRKTLLT